MNTLRRTILLLRRVFRQFRLPLNFSAGKSKAKWMPLDLVLVHYAWPCGTRTRAMLNVSMSTALQPFVFVVPTSIWGALFLYSPTCHQKYWLVLLPPIVLWVLFVLLSFLLRAVDQKRCPLFLCFEQIFSPHTDLAEAQWYSDAQDGRHQSQPCSCFQWLSLS